MEHIPLKIEQKRFLFWYIRKYPVTAYAVMSERLLKQGWYDDSDADSLNYLRNRLTNATDDYLNK
jgi:hypothetical protein